MNVRVDDLFLIDDPVSGSVIDEPRYTEVIQPVYSPAVGVSVTTPKPTNVVTVQPANPGGVMPISLSPGSSAPSTPTVELTPAQQAALTQTELLDKTLADEEGKASAVPTWVYLAGGALVVYLITR